MTEPAANDLDPAVSAGASADPVDSWIRRNRITWTYVGIILLGALFPLLAWVFFARSFNRQWIAAKPSIAASAKALALLFLSGGFWYVRNLALTKNPTFPVAIEIGPWTLARGLYGREAMRAWDYHLRIGDLRPLWEFFAETGISLRALVALGALMALARRLQQRDGGVKSLHAKADGALTLTLVSSVCLCWFVVPYQQSRFFFSTWGIAVMLSLLLLDRHARSSASARRMVKIVWVAAVLGMIVEFPTRERILVLALGALAAIAHAAAIRAKPSPTHVFLAPLLHRYATIGLIVLFAGTLAGFRLAGASSEIRYVVGDSHDDAWAWVATNVHQQQVAYAGSNLPFPLWGSTLENVVHYVPAVALHEAALHGYARDGAANAEPAPDRARPQIDRWLENLDRAKIEILFVSALYPVVQRSELHDAEDFPPERAWADAHPERFALAFANAGVRIYRIRTHRIRTAQG